MEDDDETSSRTSSQMLNNNSIASLLYCDEDPLVSTTPPPPPPEASSCVVLVPPQQQASVLATVGDVEEEDHLKELLVNHLARQRFYAPTCRGGYLEHLLTPQQQQQQQQQQGSAPPEAAIIPGTGSASGARSRGVHYIIYAFGRLGLTVATVFNAVNYLDRFLSINCHLQCWEAWMVELVSVACLSIACKLDEVNIPSLHHLQMEEVMSHSFLPATVQDMELTLLKALQWRLACVTPYSFLQLFLSLTPHTTVAVASHCTRLLICSLTASETY
ncbi:unnamed protein product [Miscanthus lutarioriparius]|uniref:Cyclin-like domain-containing protein n=1 Tax=Miscanthus lutarioriparius TaxID=422564 RepID=A0A811QHF0_9POAL|nr:unnamed protein product [Miscanthus lutarioriparius]